MFEGAQDRVKVVDRRNPVSGFLWDMLIGMILIVGPDDLVAKEIEAGLLKMRIRVDVQVIRRIVRGSRVKK